MSRISDPFWPFMQLRREISNLLDNFGFEGSGGRGEYPALNIWEDGDNLYAEAEVPGVAQTDVEVFTMGDELTIRGRRPADTAEGATYHRRERGVGEFQRVVKLPADVDAEKVEARLANGVLTVKLPKAEQARPRKISVTAG